MKVVLFCGGFGTRLREHSETIPKPLVDVGNRPIIWHLMKYYAHFGHAEFILCLGYGAHLIKDYFVNYREWHSNDFTLSDGGRELQLHNQDIRNWTITFVDTGLASNIGQRLQKIQSYLGDDEMFLANYSDGLSDLPLNEQVETFRNSDAVVSFAAVRPSHSLSGVWTDSNSLVTRIEYLHSSDILINGGFFVMRREVFDYIEPTEELVEEPFQKMIAQKKLQAYKYLGFWTAMDTFKEKKFFDSLYASGDMPWMVWDDRNKRDSSDECGAT